MCVWTCWKTKGPGSSLTKPDTRTAHGVFLETVQRDFKMKGVDPPHPLFDICLMLRSMQASTKKNTQTMKFLSFPERKQEEEEESQSHSLKEKKEDKWRKLRDAGGFLFLHGLFSVNQVLLISPHPPVYYKAQLSKPLTSPLEHWMLMRCKRIQMNVFLCLIKECVALLRLLLSSHGNMAASWMSKWFRGSVIAVLSSCQHEIWR